MPSRNGIQLVPVALTSAERQRRYRERRAANEPVRKFEKVAIRGRRTRPQRWRDAVATLRALQAEYEEWRDGLPESLAASRTAELLDEVCDLDLDALDVQLPRGFGRD
jgi:hypothetical protein